jgi:MFS family permease
MTGVYDYNQLLSVFYISYILAEVPSNIACKWMGPGWFIPILSLCFGIASVGTAFVTNLSQACVVRFILGIFESGMMPGIAYYMSRWYRRSELSKFATLPLLMSQPHGNGATGSHG